MIWYSESNIILLYNITRKTNVLIPRLRWRCRDRVVVGFTSSVYVVSDFDKGDDFSEHTITLH